MKKKIANMKMNFGKHEGTHIMEVPADYLQWMLSDEFRWLSTLEHGDIKKVLVSRGVSTVPEPISTNNPMLNEPTPKLTGPKLSVDLEEANKIREEMGLPPMQ